MKRMETSTRMKRPTLEKLRDLKAKLWLQKKERWTYDEIIGALVTKAVPKKMEKVD